MSELLGKAKRSVRLEALPWPFSREDRAALCFQTVFIDSSLPLPPVRFAPAVRMSSKHGGRCLEDP